MHTIEEKQSVAAAIAALKAREEVVTTQTVKEYLEVHEGEPLDADLKIVNLNITLIQQNMGDLMGFRCCKECYCWINPKLSSADHGALSGMFDEPRAPGDVPDLCDVCSSEK